jgi:Ankyrin repeats (3 copies)
MNGNQPKNIFNSDYYLKHLFDVFKTYPKMTFFIFANEYLFQFNEYWFRSFEYPYWWRKLLSAILLVLMFKYSDWRPEKPMEQAITENNIQEIQRLIQNHPWQVNVTGLHGYTPLHFACTPSINNEIVLLLLESGANSNALSTDKGTPIHQAALAGSVVKLEYLIQYGANLDIQDYRRKTPLHWAIDSNSLPTVTFLVEHSADRTICDENGKTPLELSRNKSEREDIFNYLNSLDSPQA